MYKTKLEYLKDGALAASLLTICIWSLAGCKAAVAEDPAGGDNGAQMAADAAPAASAVDAGALWAKNCKSCHGDDGKGQTKAGKMKKVRDLTSAEVRAEFDRDRMIKSVSDGMNDEAGKSLMKPYAEKLSADEIAALVDHVLALPQ